MPAGQVDATSNERRVEQEGLPPIARFRPAAVRSVGAG